MTPARLFRAALAAAALSASAAGPAGAGGGVSVECRLDGVVQRIEVVRDPMPGRRCEMRYSEAEGRPIRVVWFSERDRSFCHDRADILIATLARRGWVCDVMRRRNVAAESDREARAGPAPAVPRPH